MAAAFPTITHPGAETMKLSARELASVLAGLRMVQHFNDTNAGQIASDFDADEQTAGLCAILDDAGRRLDNDEIDELAHRLNRNK